MKKTISVTDQHSEDYKTIFYEENDGWVMQWGGYSCR